MANYWPYASYRAPIGRMLIILSALTGIELLADYWSGWPNLQFIPGYLPLHTLTETISIIIAVMVFSVGWYSQSKKQLTTVILSIGFLAVAVLDLWHFISYPGMPDVISTNDLQKHLYFWLAARLIAALSLFLACGGMPKIVVTRLTRYLMLFFGLAIVIVYCYAVIEHQSWFPDLFVAGSGLTPTKKNLEYGVTFINVSTAFILLIRMRKIAVFNAVLLFGGACTLALSELFFTNYKTMTGSFNVLGHVYKVIAYLMIYRAIVVEVIEEPYTLLKESEISLGISQKRYERLTSNISTGVYLVRSNAAKVLTYEYVSKQFCTLLHVTEAEIYSNSNAYLKHIVAEDQESMMHAIQIAFDTYRYFKWEGRVEVNGITTWLSVEGKPEKQTNGDYLWDGVVIDITKNKQNESLKLSQQANYDSLTLLPNRRLMMDRLDQAIKKSARAHQSLALLFIDLDRFKEINDTQGHQAGDAVLIEAAKRIKACVRDYDTVARFGGDEFTVILGDHLRQSDIERIANAITIALDSPFNINEETSYISGSIGIAIYPEDGATTNELLQSADIAMYEAKKHGGNNHKLFTKALKSAVQQRVKISTDLRSAIKLGQMEVVYQPMICLSNSRIIKAEALLRWYHPELGSIDPATFIAIAEYSGSIHEIGEWVFEQAILAAQRIKKILGIDFQITVNISPIQFKMFSNQRLKMMLRAANISGHCIALEITENLVLDDLNLISDRLQQFRADGIEILIDDFGTGYSSLAYLRNLPLDYLKIDQLFIHKLNSNDQSLALCESIISMAHRLDLKVIAEGIETLDQLHILKSIGCDYGQGYLFSKPMSFYHFEKLLLLQPDDRFLSESI